MSSSSPLPHVTGTFSLALLPQVIPPETVAAVLAEAGKTSRRRRALPTDFLVYYIIALALYLPDSCREVLRRVQDDLRQTVDLVVQPAVAGKSAITQARTRLGPTVLQTLFERLVAPLATRQTRGAWYRQWRVVSLDGTTLATPTSTSNAAAFGHSGSKHGPSAFPLARLVTLVEAGTHVLFGAALGAWRTAEATLARPLLALVTPEMLLLADRYYFGDPLWRTAVATGAALLWRLKQQVRLPVEQRLADGSYLSTTRSPQRGTPGHRVRVIEYQLRGRGPVYRLVTNLLEPTQAPARELAALYHERWEHETTLDELKTHLRGGADVRLRSASADLVRQEVYGLLLAHYAVRSVLHAAAQEAAEDPDHLSFLHAVRVLRRHLPRLAALPPSAVVRLVGGRPRRGAAGARLLQSRPPRAPRRAPAHQPISHPPRRPHRRPVSRLPHPH